MQMSSRTSAVTACELREHTEMQTSETSNVRETRTRGFFPMQLLAFALLAVAACASASVLPTGFATFFSGSTCPPGFARPNSSLVGCQPGRRRGGRNHLISLHLV